MAKTYDFGGWATRNDLLCSDGRTIRKGAFKDCSGKTVPLVWNHQHNDAFNVLGHALLENRENGVYAYCTFNETEQGQNARELVAHGDVSSLSIFANKLKQNGGDVLHGIIREVSLVLAGANPGAFIDSVLVHGEDGEEDGAVIFTGKTINVNDPEFSHADEEEYEEYEDLDEEETDSEDPDEDEYEEDEEDEEQDEMSHADNTKRSSEMASEKTVQDVIDSMTEEQKNVMYALVGQAVEDAKGNNPDEEDENDMKHNAFENDYPQQDYLSHADVQQIFKDAKQGGSLREAVQNFIGDEEGVLAHAIPTEGMDIATGTQTYGFNDASMLFPEARTIGNRPEWLSRDMGWVREVMSGVHKTPFSRIKSVYANITEDEARARGYMKGKQKKEEVFTTLKRVTTPQTIYKKQKLDRDDIIDITDFDIVAWIREEMRMMLEEEIARAVLIGDGRPDDSDDKIHELNVRPIMKDVPLFNTKVAVNFKAGADEDETNQLFAKAAINAAIRSRKNYKGSGNPVFYTTEDVLTEMLLLEDGIGHKLYKTEAELATALRVRKIVTVEPMEGQKIEINSEQKDLVGIIVNLDDYNIGADKGGATSMFDDFDIDFNQYKYLIETRLSGALIKPFSALTLYKNQQP